VARPAVVAAGHGGRYIDAAAAAGVRGVHPRLLVPAGADAFLADCGVPLRANRTLRNDEHRWRLLFSRLIAPVVDDTHDPAAAAALMLGGYRPNTRRSYMSKWRFFLAYCAAHGRVPLPATPATVVGYTLWEQRRRALSPPSLQKYFSAVASAHAVAGYDDPTKHFLVRLCVHGYRKWALEEAGGELAPQRMPLPAGFILRVCDLGLSTPDAHLRVQCAGLVLGFLLFNRPGATACMRSCGVAFSPHGMELQIVDFKLALWTGHERHAFTVPIDGDATRVDKPVALVRLVWDQHRAAARARNALLFADPALPPPVRLFHLAARTTNFWLRRVLSILPLRAPLGGVYQDHSVRSGAATEAYALGVPLPMISEMLGHASLEPTLRGYVRTRWRSSPAAREVLGRFLPSPLRL